MPLQRLGLQRDQHLVNPTNYSRVEPISLIGAYDLNTLEFLPAFQPDVQFDGESLWQETVDSNGCLWAGGDIHHGYTGACYGGFAKLFRGVRGTVDPVQRERDPKRELVHDQLGRQHRQQDVRTEHEVRGAPR